MTKIKTRIKRPPTRLLVCLGLLSVLSACNVTRRVTTESSYITKGDTCIVISTKTVETYDASKSQNNF